MKKKMRMLLLAAMSFALLLLPACGGGSDEGASAPAVEESDVSEEPVGYEEEEMDDKVETEVTTEELAIVINDKKISMPFYMQDMADAGVPVPEDIMGRYLSQDDYSVAELYLDEEEKIVISPEYYNSSDETIPITEAEARKIHMASSEAELKDRGVSIFGVKFGMTRDEVRELLGKPMWVYDGVQYYWALAVSDTGQEGELSVYFDDDSKDSHVFMVSLEIYEY